MVKRTLIEGVGILLVAEGFLAWLLRGAMWGTTHLVFAGLVVLATGMVQTLILGERYRSYIKRKVAEDVGFYEIIHVWGRLTNVVGKDGNILILTEENKLVKVEIRNLQVGYTQVEGTIPSGLVG